MKRILGGVLAVAIAGCPVVAMVGVALPSLAQEIVGTSEKLEVDNDLEQRRQSLQQYYDNMLPTMREQNNRVGEALILNEIGLIYFYLGERKQALQYYSQALNLVQAADHLGGEASILTNIGALYDAAAQYQEALETYNQALAIHKEVRNKASEAVTLSNIGIIYHRIGYWEKALDRYNQALSIQIEEGDRLGEAATLNNIGAVYSELGQLEQALDSYKRALVIHQEIENSEDRVLEATILSNMSVAYNKSGQYQESLNRAKQALSIHQEVGYRVGEATMLNNIGKFYHDLDQPQKALDRYNQALTIHRELGGRAGEATVLNNIGLFYTEVGDLKKALDRYNQALTIFQEIGELTGQVAPLANMGFSYLKNNQPQRAIKLWEQSVEIALELRSGLKRDNRQRFLQNGVGTHIALISLLIDENQADRAFEWLHRTTTADLADYTKLIDAKVSADANSEVQKAVDEWNRRYYEIQFFNNDLQENFSEDKSRQLNQKWAELRTHEQEIIENFPEVAELFETQPTDIAKLRNSIPKDTVLLQPTLLTGVENVENEIALFVVTRDSLDVVKVPIDPDAFDSLLSEYRQQLTNPNRLDYANNQKQLYDWFIRPVEDKIRATSPKSLAIIATGKLRYIPFETFRDRETNEYLIDKYPVYYLTRISTRSLASQTDTFPWRWIGIGAMIIIAVYGKVGIAHPRKIRTIALVIAGLGTIALLVFPSNNSRVLGLGNPVPNGKQNLPATEEEVNNITKMMRGSAAFLRQDATLDRFQTNAPNFPILHLATHGCFQELGCENIGMDANTLLFADTQFHIRDAILLGLENTDLIALSACQTAMETYSDGREISGMAYILERAGANAVMATLWSVADESSKDLAIAFYRHAKRRNNKAAALRQAKLELREQDAHPYFWSPLILIGEGQ